MPDELATPEIICSICEQPLPLESAKVDDHGRAVQEACYAQTIDISSKLVPRAQKGAFSARR